MNALVAPLRPLLSKLDDSILWLCVKHPPMCRSGIARILGVTASTISQAMNRLAHLGYIDHGRGSCIPRPAALNYVDTLVADGFDMCQLEPRGSNVERSGGGGQAVDREPNRQQAPEQSASPAALDMPLMVAALAAHQDPLLAAANARLQRRVLELEAEVQELRDQRAKALLRLGFVCDALTG